MSLGGGRPTTARRPRGFASASELQALLRAGRAAEADPYLPPLGRETASMAHIDRAVLARLRTMDEADWAALPDGGAAEGLPARLARSARTADSLEDFYARAKTKRYPHARLRRLAPGRLPGAAGGGAAPGGALCTGAGPQRPGAGAAAPHERDLCPSGGGQARPGQGLWMGTPAPSLRRRPAAQICSACASPQPGPAGWSGLAARW